MAYALASYCERTNMSKPIKDYFSLFIKNYAISLISN